MDSRNNLEEQEEKLLPKQHSDKINLLPTHKYNLKSVSDMTLPRYHEDKKVGRGKCIQTCKSLHDKNRFSFHNSVSYLIYLKMLTSKRTRGA